MGHRRAEGRQGRHRALQGPARASARACRWHRACGACWWRARRRRAPLVAPVLPVLPGEHGPLVPLVEPVLPVLPVSRVGSSWPRGEQGLPGPGRAGPARRPLGRPGLQVLPVKGSGPAAPRRTGPAGGLSDVNREVGGDDTFAGNANLGATLTVTATCSSGRLVSGGGDVTGNNVKHFAVISSSYPSNATTWTVVATIVAGTQANGATHRPLTAYALCAS